MPTNVVSKTFRFIFESQTGNVVPKAREVSNALNQVAGATQRLVQASAPGARGGSLPDLAGAYNSLIVAGRGASILAAGIAPAISLEDAVKDLTVITGLGGKSLDTFVGKALEAAKITPFNPAEALQAMRDLYMTTRDVEGTMAAIVPTMSLAYTHFNKNLAPAITLTSRAVKDFNLTGAEAGTIIGGIAGLMETFGVKAGTFEAGLLKAGGLQKAWGTTWQDILPVFALTTRGFDDAAQAMTNIFSGLTRLATPKNREMLEKALNIELPVAGPGALQEIFLKLGEAFNKAGGDISSFRNVMDRAIGKHATPVFMTAFGQLRDGIKSSSGEMLKMGDIFTTATKNMEGGLEKLMKQTEDRTKTVSGQFGILKDSLWSIAALSFSPLLGGLRTILEITNQLLARVEKWMTALKDASPVIYGIIGAVGKIAVSFFGAQFAAMALLGTSRILDRASRALSETWGKIAGGMTTSAAAVTAASAATVTAASAATGVAAAAATTAATVSKAPPVATPTSLGIAPGQTFGTAALAAQFKAQEAAAVAAAKSTTVTVTAQQMPLQALYAQRMKQAEYLADAIDTITFKEQAAISKRMHMVPPALAGLYPQQSSARIKGEIAALFRTGEMAKELAVKDALKGMPSIPREYTAKLSGAASAGNEAFVSSTRNAWNRVAGIFTRGSATAAAQAVGTAAAATAATVTFAGRLATVGTKAFSILGFAMTRLGGFLAGPFGWIALIAMQYLPEIVGWAQKLIGFVSGAFKSKGKPPVDIIREEAERERKLMEAHYVSLDKLLANQENVTRQARDTIVQLDKAVTRLGELTKQKVPILPRQAMDFFDKNMPKMLRGLAPGSKERASIEEAYQDVMTVFTAGGEEIYPETRKKAQMAFNFLGSKLKTLPEFGTTIGQETVEKMAAGAESALAKAATETSMLATAELMTLTPEKKKALLAQIGRERESIESLRVGASKRLMEARFDLGVAAPEKQEIVRTVSMNEMSTVAEDAAGAIINLSANLEAAKRYADVAMKRRAELTMVEERLRAFQAKEAVYTKIMGLKYGSPEYYRYIAGLATKKEAKAETAGAIGEKEYTRVMPGTKAKLDEMLASASKITSENTTQINEKSAAQLGLLKEIRDKLPGGSTGPTTSGRSSIGATSKPTGSTTSLGE